MDENKEITPYYAYRNNRNINSSDMVNRIIPFRDLYKKTGIQFAEFNTIYQLYDDYQKGRLDKATDYLMLPSYFIFKLTGIKTHEYTNESTTSLLNPRTCNYNFNIIDELKLPRKLFKNIMYPGSFIGDLLPEVADEVGGNTKVILCSTHDTGSAFESIDVPDDGIIISSGTWSLLGIKSKKPIINEDSLNANFTNEGGASYIRFLKNVMGMWINNQLKKETNIEQANIDKKIYKVDYRITFDVNDKSLMAPKSMKKALLNLLKKCPPRNDLELFDSIYRSMALSYKNSIEELERITNKTYKSIHIIGGGAKNEYLNRLVEEYTNKKVIALPIEIQMKASKEL